MERAFKFVEGFILGSLVGATVALLLAPTSGADLRNRMQSETERIRAEVNKAAMERRAELEQQLSALRAPRTPSA
jgi:gas vesicle protein